MERNPGMIEPVRMDQKTQRRGMRKLGAAPDFAVGSVHSVTETVIWVVGTRKIVKDRDEVVKRILVNEALGF